MGLVEDTISAYEASAQDYMSKHSDINIIKNWADLFISKLRENEGEYILDVGCANGRDLKYFSDNGFRVTGIDLVPEFLKAAKEAVPEAIVYNLDMRQVDDLVDYYDGIWSMASFLHIPRDEANKTMKAHNIVLKPKGVMFMSVMGGGRGDDPLPPSDKYGGFSKYFYSYGENEFRDILTSSGFSIEDFVVEEKHKTFLNALVKKTA